CASRLFRHHSLREEFLQNKALYFSCTGHRSVVYENYATRNFKAREVLAAVIHDLSSVTDLPVLNSMNTATSTRRLSGTPIATACFTASCFTRIASTSAAGWTLTPSDSSSEQQTSMIKGLS